MSAVEAENCPGDGTNNEHRVQLTSKKQVMEQMGGYKDLLRTALRGQADIPADTQRALLQELLANFEAAVQDNVLVNGLPWEEAPDAEEDWGADLDSLLDDTIVETSRRRRKFPRQILPHVVHSLKTERKLMGLYEKAVKPKQVVQDPDQESIMTTLSAAAPVMVKQAIQVIKSINTLQKQAEGLCEVLNMKPSSASLEVHKEVFGHNGHADAPRAAVGAAARNRQPIKRAVEDAAATDCYVPLAKKPEHPERPAHGGGSE
ncbi:kinetochore-associated protein NSL1 homolog isoform X2 [Echeneis naucrates]|uniref:NSL1 component of MIS12 kinetochore complex n=1 Tax=Echeneis naucrates TaxID=173247 RepID=A0A665UGK7_ECHNA|nr:kinetochore-associated protein NSL1 homolog isoform X2 [Echeneis naucrates]